MPSSDLIDRALGDALVREGTLDAAAIARAEAHRKKAGGTLEDSLLLLQLCGEREVLRALAKTWRFQYLMTDKAEQLKIPDAVLERVPVRLAEQHWILPFRLDESGVLWILTTAPVDEHVLVDLIRSTGAKALNRLLVRRATAWAAIRRHYYRDFAAFQRKAVAPSVEKSEQPDPQDPFDRAEVQTISRTLRCPNCGAPASIRNFQCRSCGLLLNPEARAEREGQSETSVVRAMMSGGAEPRRQRGRAADERPTVKAEAPMEGGVVPRLVAGLDVVERPLSEFEAFVASFIDGETDVVGLARAAELQEVETQAILRSLADRKIVELSARPAMKRNVAEALARVRKAGDPATPARGVPAASRDLAAESALQQAVTLERAGQAEQAIAVLRDGIAKLSRPAPLYNRLALVLLEQREDHVAAEELLKKACALEPKNEIYQRNLYKVLGMAAIRALAIDKN